MLVDNLHERVDKKFIVLKVEIYICQRDISVGKSESNIFFVLARARECVKYEEFAGKYSSVYNYALLGKICSQSTKYTFFT